jgi:hypothetical protein
VIRALLLTAVVLAIAALRPVRRRRRVRSAYHLVARACGHDAGALRRTGGCARQMARVDAGLHRRSRSTAYGGRGAAAGAPRRTVVVSFDEGYAEPAHVGGSVCAARLAGRALPVDAVPRRRRRDQQPAGRSLIGRGGPGDAHSSTHPDLYDVSRLSHAARDRRHAPAIARVFGRHARYFFAIYESEPLRRPRCERRLRAAAIPRRAH